MSLSMLWLLNLEKMLDTGSKRHSTFPIDHLTFENIHWIDSVNPGHL